jgi:hypothetical protein
VRAAGGPFLPLSSFLFARSEITQQQAVGRVLWPRPKGGGGGTRSSEVSPDDDGVRPCQVSRRAKRRNQKHGRRDWTGRIGWMDWVFNKTAADASPCAHRVGLFLCNVHSRAAYTAQFND